MHSQVLYRNTTKRYGSYLALPFPHFVSPFWQKESLNVPWCHRGVTSTVRMHHYCQHTSWGTRRYKTQGWVSTQEDTQSYQSKLPVTSRWHRHIPLRLPFWFFPKLQDNFWDGKLRPPTRLVLTCTDHGFYCECVSRFHHTNCLIFWGGGGGIWNRVVRLWERELGTETHESRNEASHLLA